MTLPCASRRALEASALLLLVALGRAATGEPQPPEGWGTSHPIIPQAISPRGDWIVACQARRDTDGDGQVKVSAGHHGGPHGDDVQTYLFQGPGDGRLVTEFVSASSSGDHVALLLDGSLRLLSVRDGKEIDLSALGADARDHEVAFWPHRAVRFDDDGRRMAWFRGGTPEVAGLMLRDLASGADRRIDLGPGLAVMASFLRGGGWIEVLVVREWRPENSGPSFPSLGTSLDPRRCRAVPLSYSTFGGSAARRIESCAVSVHGTALRCATGILGQIGPDLLVRREDGGLVRWDPAGAEHLLVASELAPWVEALSVGEGTALVCCTAGAKTGSWFLVSANGSQAVTLTAMRASSGPTPEQDQDSLLRDRWAYVTENGVEKRVDLRSGDVSALPEEDTLDGEWLGSAWENRRVRVRGAKTVIHDFATKREHPIELGMSLAEVRPHEVRSSGPMRAMAGVVIDLESLRVFGGYTGEALAVASDGRVLVAAGPGRQGVYPGPLRWPRPTPPAPPAGR